MFARAVAVACLTAGYWIALLVAGLFALLTVVQYVRGDPFARPGFTMVSAVLALVVAAACHFAHKKFSAIAADE
jgi:hypothetical protein